MAPCIKVGKYILKKKIGSGAFAEVRLAVHEDTSEEFAVKIFNRAAFPKADFERDVKREIKIMQYLRHPNIVTIHAVLVTAKKLYLVMELVRGGELYDEIVRKRRVDERTSRYYFQQIVDAMVYCHRRGVVHRDLKPENLLLDSNGVVKITDFGMSWIKENTDPERNAKQLLQTQCGTPKYMAPEIILRPPNGYDGEKLDAWECGMVLYALLAGHLPFSGEDDDEVFHEIVSGQLRFPRHFSPGAKDLLLKLLEKDPEKRSSLSQIRGHFWFLVNYHGDAVNERKAALRKARPGPVSAGLWNSKGGDHSGNSSRGRKDEDAEMAELTKRKLAMKAHVQLPVNVDTAFKDNGRDSRSRSRSIQKSPRSRSRSRSRLRQKLQDGTLVLSSLNNSNVSVVPKPKGDVKINIPKDDCPDSPDEELHEELCDKSLETPAASPQNADRAVNRSNASFFQRRERAPPLSIKVSSKSTNDPADDDEAPSSFRDRLLSPFGAMIRSLRSATTAEEADLESGKGATSWFADTSPVSDTTGTYNSSAPTPTSKKQSTTRVGVFGSPQSHDSSGGLFPIPSDESLPLDDAPPSSKTFRRIAALLQKKA